ncbi:MAG: HIT family protein [Bacteroidetes bacterium]|nr:MAG: HIT family protein [Bacteroidota bacterium]
MPSIFTRIVQGEIPAYKVAETDDFLAFLDIRPLTKGHTLAIPKLEVDYLFDLPDEQYVGLQVFAREVARALAQAVPCKRIGTAVLGLEVPHAHIHLVPLQKEGDLNFRNPPVEMSPEEMETLAAHIRSFLGS